MKTVEGWLVPDMLSGPGKYMRRAIEDAPIAIEACSHRRVAVQAGGHVGTWPVFLSKHFATIYTFEPVAENFFCLVHNVRAHAQAPESIFAARGALGNDRGPIDIVLSGKSSGQHRARYPADAGLGAVPLYRLDDLKLPVLDALFLDLEGFENHALRGAAETLQRLRPVVMAENNKRALNQGFKLESLAALMKGLGYIVKASPNEDIVFIPR